MPGLGVWRDPPSRRASGDGFQLPHLIESAEMGVKMLVPGADRPLIEPLSLSPPPLSAISGRDTTADRREISSRYTRKVRHIHIDSGKIRGIER